MNEYTVIQYTQGTLVFQVQAESEEEAIDLVKSGKVDYEEHDWDENGEPFIDE